MPHQATYTIPASLPLCAGEKRIFAFDLDGTITSAEMLPLIAGLAGLREEIAELTRRTLNGEICFEESFRKRFAMLRHIPLSLVRECVDAVPLDPYITDFITSRRKECVVVTGNLDLWVMPLLNRLGCRYFASRGTNTASGLVLLSVLDKGAAARSLLGEKHRIIAIGESMNDVPLFEAASLGIAYAGVHAPVPEIRRIARFRASDGAGLCRLMNGM